MIVFSGSDCEEIVVVVAVVRVLTRLSVAVPTSSVTRLLLDTTVSSASTRAKNCAGSRYIVGVLLDTARCVSRSCRQSVVVLLEEILLPRSSRYEK